MQIRYEISLALAAIIVPTIELFTVNPAIAQYGQGYEDRDPHFYCDGLARERAERYSQNDGVGNVVGGAAGGAARGAIIGAILGDAGAGAGIGAVQGGYRGGRDTRNNRERFYWREYNDCMRRNGR